MPVGMSDDCHLAFNHVRSEVRGSCRKSVQGMVDMVFVNKMLRRTISTCWPVVWLNIEQPDHPLVPAHWCPARYGDFLLVGLFLSSLWRMWCGDHAMPAGLYDRHTGSLIRSSGDIEFPVAKWALGDDVIDNDGELLCLRE